MRSLKASVELMAQQLPQSLCTHGAAGVGVAGARARESEPNAVVVRARAHQAQPQQRRLRTWSRMWPDTLAHAGNASMTEKFVGAAVTNDGAPGYLERFARALTLRGPLVMVPISADASASV